MDYFESPKLLLENASTDIDDLNVLFKQTISNCTARQAVERDPKTENKTFKIVLGKNVPDTVRVKVMRVINDMRHALDQAACAAFCAVNRTDAPDHLYFPIAANAKDLQGRLRKHFPVSLHSVFASIEPYPSQDGLKGGNNAICLLGKTAQRKHRMVCRIAPNVTAVQLNEVCWTDPISINPIFPVYDPIKNEYIFGTTTPTGDFKFNGKIAFEIALYQTGTVDGRPAAGILQYFHAAASNAVALVERETLKIV